MCWATRIGQGKSPAAGSAAPPARAGRRSRCRPAPARRRPPPPGRRVDPTRVMGGSPPGRRRGADPVAHALLAAAGWSAAGRPAAARTLATSCGASSSMRSETAPSGFGDEIDRAQAQRLQRRSRAVRGQRRDHHHRAGPLDHDAVEAGQAVHLRHVDVERDDVGREARQLVQRLQPVAGEPHLEIGFAAKILPSSFRTSAESSTTRTLITNRRCASHSASNASSRPRSARLSSSAGSSSSTIRPAASRLMTPCTSRVGFAGQVRRRLDRCRRSVRSTSETLSTIRPARWRSVRTTIRRWRSALARELRHVEAAALVDHRQHLAAQIDHAFEEFRRLGQRG